ncbi:50S ribosomal protein L21 [Prochlorococcus marinus]|uniref:Large ribosomal subunit protein bL21 n=1 Tax=Prochlorococcus marinus (strain MIT 9211) TaxID=93059 RepID=A9BBW7_PROM4|nr:50S ribosomal protein L21 [Prochlorococcus marinus]ABX09329.1 50S ribosomal protein L21 [Prochlorococcus marinus str. MIT 9211]
MTSSKKTTDKSTTSSSSSNYAIVETSGSQFWLEANRYYELDRINADIDEIITLDKVLLLNDEKGITLGKPYIDGAKVEVKVIAHRRGPKIIVYKMRPKKKTRRKNGHRQELTRVMVQSIKTAANKVSATKGKVAAPKVQTKKEAKGSKTVNKAKEPSKVKTPKTKGTATT